MQFELVHEVGNRTRWRTKVPMTLASAAIIAGDLEGIEGVTGLEVNPRTGSVVVTVADVAARGRVVAQMQHYRTCAPIHRHCTADGRARIAQMQRERKAQQVRRRSVVARIAERIDHVFGNMPAARILRRIQAAAVHLTHTAAMSAPADGRRFSAALGQGSDASRLDFGPLARFMFLRPMLPIRVNQFNAVAESLPRILEGIKALGTGKLNVPVLDAAALLVSLLRRDFTTAGLLVVLLGLGEMLESFTRKRSMARLADELALRVDSVWIRDEKCGLRQKQLSEVVSSDRIVVQAGSAIPVDGIVTAGEGEVNQASMTGEALPVRRSAGGAVFAGTVLEAGEIDVRPTGVGSSTRLSQIVDFIEKSEKLKAGIQSKAERWADRIVPLHFILAAVVWLLTRNANRAASVLMVDFSCALRLATPLAILTAMRTGTHASVVVKGGRYLEVLSEVDTVVFDKTGTLTESAPKLAQVISLDPDLPEREVLRLAACLEEHFPHPVGRAVVKAAEESFLVHEQEKHDAQINYIVAHGIASSLAGRRVVLGSRHFVQDDEGVDVSSAADQRERLASQGLSILYLAVGGRLVGLLGVEDPIRRESAETIRMLRCVGIRRIVMLTGDDQKTAAAVASRLGIDEFRAGILPHEKAQTVQALRRSGAKVLMIGDGVNDSPALSAADVGVTLADGADIAREVAEVVLVDNDLRLLIVAIELGRACMRRIRQNFGISVGLNAAFLAGGLGGLLTPALGALMHNATTIGVCLNAMRDPNIARLDLRRTLDNAVHAEGTERDERESEAVAEAIVASESGLADGLKADQTTGINLGAAQ